MSLRLKLKIKNMAHTSKEAQEFVDKIKASNGIKSDVISRSCIDCCSCICLSGESGITFACLRGRYGTMTTLKIFEEIKILRCEKYVAGND